MSGQPRERWAWTIPVAIGVCAFLLLVGPRVLDWQNVAWLGRGDASTHYLGWLFFRQAPWSVPPGLNPGYGLELSNSVVYSDSNPLLALLFKPLAALLPAIFQYFGAWMLACFVMQAWLGHRLVGLASDDAWVRAMGAVFFVFAPTMLIRTTEHLSLASHFLLLGALYLVLAPRPRARRAAWAGLLAVSALVHAYLFIMVALFWAVDLAARRRRQEFGWGPLAAEAAGLLALSAFACWLAGYFVPGGAASEGGYGYYRANLVTFFNPMAWSYVLPDLAQGEGDYEGYVYLGLGVILLYLCVLPALWRRGRALTVGVGRHGLLIAALAGLALFAVSHKVGLGQREWVLPIPETLLHLAGVFRASGRMMWPVYYVAVLLAIVLVWRAWPPRTARILLAAALCVQLADTHAGWSQQRGYWMGAPARAWATPLQHPFWDAAAQRYDQVRWMPPQNLGPHWKALAEYAGRHGMATDAIYLARVDAGALARLREQAAARVEAGRYDEGAIYVFDDALFRAARMQGDGARDLYARVDGLNVVAPGWHACAGCPAVAAESTGMDSVPALRADLRLGFAEGDEDGAAYMGGGWSHREAWGTWSEGNRAVLFLPLAGSGLKVLEFEVQPLLGPRLRAQRVQVLIDGAAVLATELGERATLAVPVPRDAAQAGPALSRLEFILPDAARPMDIGGGADPRRLGIGLVAVTAR